MLGQQRLGRLPLDHRVGDRVGVALVAVAGLADPALEVHAGALLDHVGRLCAAVCRSGAPAKAMSVPVA
jgi:hypothetical protein